MRALQIWALLWQVMCRIITGDIDRGGIIAQLVGTYAVLPDADKAQIAGFIVNKFEAMYLYLMMAIR